MPDDNHSQFSASRSRSPEQDAAVLVKVFPSFRIERWQSTDSIALHLESTVTLMLVKTESTVSISADPTIFILSAETIGEGIRNCDSLTGLSHAGLNGSSLHLSMPGGASIVFLTTELMASPNGRETLAIALASSKQELIELISRDMSVPGDSSFPDSLEEETLEDVEINGKDIMHAEDEKIPEERASVPSIIPSLAVSVLMQDGIMKHNIRVNSTVTIPVETELFIGCFLLILRPLDPMVDPYWNERIFAKQKRRFICQLQGKLKYVPTGPVYAGFEVTDPMKLGLITKSLCGALLKFLKSFNSQLHYSFGSDKEKAHIVFPAWSSFERFIVTKPGETPPVIGEEFVESKESVAARKAMRSKPQWNMDDTYSMSFYTMYFDLAQWKLVNLPVMNDIDLHTFWKNSDCRLSIYEKTGKGDRHLISQSRYALVLQIKFLGFGNDAVQEDASVLPWDKGRRPSMLQRNDRQESGSFLVGESERDDYIFFDAEEDNSDHEVDRDDLGSASFSVTGPMKLLAKVDSLCPAWIEISHKGRYITAFAVPLWGSSITTFRTYQEVEAFFGTNEAKETVEEIWSPRLSSTEKRRRIVGVTLSKLSVDANPEKMERLNQFHNLTSEINGSFLKRKVRSVSPRRAALFRKAGYVARAISDRHWMEEWAVITNNHILLFNPEKQKPHFRIALRKVLKVQKLTDDKAPRLPSYSFLEIETLGRSFYLMFPSDTMCDAWIDTLASVIPDRDGGQSVDSAGSNANDLWMTVDDPTDEFLHKSSMWNCKQRRILNGGVFSFRTNPSQDPHALVTDVLLQALKPREGSDDITLRGFLEAAAALKDVDAYHMDEQERLSFFLNVYHALIMHAFLVLGPPDSVFKWMSYFNTISYQCSDDIFSLAELEHCIIRAAMAYPSQFISKFVLPRAQYRFAVSCPDFRICFALNCGSTSNPDCVPMYTKSLLDQQLADATRWYIQRAVQVARRSSRSTGIVVTLPKVCQWFSNDIGNGSLNDVLLTVQKFLEGEKRALLALYYSESERRFNSNDIQVKYLSYSFECRNLRLMRTESPFSIE